MPLSPEQITESYLCKGTRTGLSGADSHRKSLRDVCYLWKLESGSRFEICFFNYSKDKIQRQEMSPSLGFQLKSAPAIKGAQLNGGEAVGMFFLF